MRRYTALQSFLTDAAVRQQCNALTFKVNLQKGVTCSIYHITLPFQAWGLWKEGRCVELLDDAPSGTCPVSEVLRCIHVALLCVQERAAVRPAMATVAMMLSSETFPLPEPRRPGFVVFRRPKHATATASTELPQHSWNGVTNTVLEGR